jgi:hypothetical protein
MRVESDWATAVAVGRIQDKTRWTKALGEADTSSLRTATALLVCVDLLLQSSPLNGFVS